MKTTFLSSILTIGLLSVSTIVSAQLKVSDTGKVSIGGLNPKSNCTLTFGNPSGYTTGRYLMLSSDSYSGTKDHYGFFNLFYDDSSVPKSFGLYSSIGGNCTKKIGVVGELYSTFQDKLWWEAMLQQTCLLVL